MIREPAYISGAEGSPKKHSFVLRYCSDPAIGVKSVRATRGKVSLTKMSPNLDEVAIADSSGVKDSEPLEQVDINILEGSLDESYSLGLKWLAPAHGRHPSVQKYFTHKPYSIQGNFQQWY